MTKAATDIRELKKLFEAQAFDTALDTLAGDTPLPTRKAEREKALRHVRKCLAALERDKVVTMVLDNPFQHGILGACTRLMTVLADVEENVQICVGDSTPFSPECIAGGCWVKAGCGGG